MYITHRLVGSLLAGMFGSLAVLVDVHARDDVEELVDDGDTSQLGARLAAARERGTLRSKK